MRICLLALGLAFIFSSVASAQLPRSQGPANPRYFPDLYKGPAWGMTLSEYYTFGNKADGPYGYAIGGYRYGSNDDILRWKQATGTAIPPGYYLQRLRDRRNERFGDAATPSGSLKPTRLQPGAANPAPKEEIPSGTAEEADEISEKNSAVEPTPAAAPRTSRRNANSRGLSAESSSQSSGLAGAEQSALKLSAPIKLRRIRATDEGSAVDKN